MAGISVQMGKYNKHVNESYGADHNIMKFYITEYSSNLGRESFIPKHGHCIGTGYQSNLRPGVYYSRKLDELDNPSVGQLLTDNYQSVTKKDFLPLKGDDGKAPFPNDTFTNGSGFLKSIHPTGFTSHSKETGPVLSEHREKFVKKFPHVNTREKRVGENEETGFTRAKNLEPLTFRPHNNFKNPCPEYYTFRPTGESVSKTTYLPFTHPATNEPLPNIDRHSEMDSGFTRYILPTGSHTAQRGKVFTKVDDIPNERLVNRIRKSDPAEYLNMTSKENPLKSLHQLQYKGDQVSSAFPRDNDVLKKESSGFALNNKPFNSTLAQKTGKESTSYGEDYRRRHIGYSKNPAFIENSVNDILGDGYTKSEKLHKPLENYEVGSQLMTLHPYVNRSMKARDPFYCEQAHQHKKRDLLVDA